jgi:hypothetical protein
VSSSSSSSSSSGPGSSGSGSSGPTAAQRAAAQKAAEEQAEKAEARQKAQARSGEPPPEGQPGEPVEPPPPPEPWEEGEPTINEFGRYDAEEKIAANAQSTEPDFNTKGDVQSRARRAQIEELARQNEVQLGVTGQPTGPGGAAPQTFPTTPASTPSEPPEGSSPNKT